MKNFILTNKSGETISTARAFNLNEAEEIFAIWFKTEYEGGRHQIRIELLG